MFLVLTMVNGELTYYESPTRTLDNTGSGVSVQQLRGIVCLVRECVSSIISFKVRMLSSYTFRIAAFYDRPVQTGGVNDWRPIFFLYFKIMAGVGWELFTLSQSVFCLSSNFLTFAAFDVYLSTQE
jgi:hypothetical protein